MSETPRQKNIRIPQISKRRRALLLVAGFAALISFQNCGRFEVNGSSKSNFGITDFLSIGGEDLVPTTDKVDPSCMSNSAYNACLFIKNPVASRGQAFQAAGSANQLLSLQTFGVRLTGLLPTGKLENGTFTIETTGTSPVSTTSLDLKASADLDGGRRYAQVATYYWLNRAQEYLTPRTGIFPAGGKAIKVYVDDTLTGWSSRTNTIHLRSQDNGNQMAWGPEIALHYLGLANLHHASGEAINRINAQTHRDCGTKGSGCCATASGCARAIASGVGDYFAALIFPQRPIIGETWANNPNGIVTCGVDRNLATAGARTATAAFGACTPQGTAGDVSVMGTVYASIWWEARKAANAAAPGADKDIDTLFMQHLSLLTGDDDFKTAIQKIASVDQRLFAGKYTPLFANALVSRSIP